METQIRLAKIEDTDSIVKLLDEVTLHLHKKGIAQWTFPWEPREIKSDIEKGYIYVLLVNERIVGTFSIKDIDNFEFLTIEPYSKYLYRIAILPDFQGKKLGIEIINYVYEYARKVNKAVYLDCWAGNEKLRSFYSNAGFEYIGDFPENDYMISVFKYN